MPADNVVTNNGNTTPFTISITPVNSTDAVILAHTAYLNSTPPSGGWSQLATIDPGFYGGFWQQPGNTNPINVSNTANLSEFPVWAAIAASFATTGFVGHPASWSNTGSSEGDGNLIYTFTSTQSTTIQPGYSIVLVFVWTTPSSPPSGSNISVIDTQGNAYTVYYSYADIEGTQSAAAIIVAQNVIGGIEAKDITITMTYPDSYNEFTGVYSADAWSNITAPTGFAYSQSCLFGF